MAEQPSLTDGPTRPSTHTSQRDIKEIPTDDTTTSIRMPPSNLTAPIDYPSLHIFVREMESETDRRRDRRTDKQTNNSHHLNVV